MKYLAVYQTADGRTGTVDVRWAMSPPSLQQVRELETDISHRFCNDTPCLVTGWYELQDDQPEDDILNHLCIKIKDQEFKVNSLIGITDQHGNCVYSVEYGAYMFGGCTHIGWYLQAVSHEETYPEDKIVHVRTICALEEDKSIQSFRRIS